MIAHRTWSIVLAAALIAWPPHALAGELDLASVLEVIRSKHKLPAIAAAVADDERIVASAAIGVRRLGEPASVEFHDRFHVGSCTKAMTATMIATLVESGEVSWSTTLAQTFPELAGEMNEQYKTVTLEQLVTHRAGVPSFTAGNAPESALLRNLTGTSTEQRAEFLKRVTLKPPQFEPGSTMMYSNGGYGLAAAMAERATGQSWEQLLIDRVFRPLGMASAAFGWPASEESPAQPCGHLKQGEAFQPHWPNNDYRLSHAIAPAGDVCCSIEDLARFAQFHLRGLRGGDTTMKPEALRRLHTPALNRYAMGWVIIPQPDGSSASWHNGSAGTFFAWMTVRPESNRAVVVAINAGGCEAVCREVTEALFDAAKGAQTARAPQPASQPDESTP